MPLDPSSFYSAFFLRNTTEFLAAWSGFSLLSRAEVFARMRPRPGGKLPGLVLESIGPLRQTIFRAATPALRERDDDDAA